MTASATEPLQARLGYAVDSKLLILNADDVGLAHAEDAATFEALDHKFVTSATAMVPAPWFTEVAAYANAHPAADLGLHLTLTSEWRDYRWGPVSSRAVGSLTGPDGAFFATAREFAGHARLVDRDDAELQAITVDHPEWGAAWRQRDFDTISSVEFRNALRDNHIVLIGWRDIQKVM